MGKLKLLPVAAALSAALASELLSWDQSEPSENTESRFSAFTTWGASASPGPPPPAPVASSSSGEIVSLCQYSASGFPSSSWLNLVASPPSTGAGASSGSVGTETALAGVEGTDAAGGAASRPSLGGAGGGDRAVGAAAAALIFTAANSALS